MVYTLTQNNIPGTSIPQYLTTTTTTTTTATATTTVVVVIIITFYELGGGGVFVCFCMHVCMFVFSFVLLNTCK